MVILQIIAIRRIREIVISVEYWREICMQDIPEYYNSPCVTFLFLKEHTIAV